MMETKSGMQVEVGSIPAKPIWHVVLSAADSLDEKLAERVRAGSSVCGVLG